MAALRTLLDLRTVTNVSVVSTVAITGAIASAAVWGTRHIRHARERKCRLIAARWAANPHDPAWTRLNQDLGSTTQDGNR